MRGLNRGWAGTKLHDLHESALPPVIAGASLSVLCDAAATGRSVGALQRSVGPVSQMQMERFFELSTGSRL